MELAGNSKNMLASRSKVMAFVAIAFYFLILDRQTETSRLPKLWLLHLKRSRQKRMVLLQIALKNTRRARRAWVWPQNQFWFESLLQGDFIEDWWKENFRISRRTFEYIVWVVGLDLAKRDTRLRQSIPVNKRVAVALWRLATGDTYRSTGLQFGIGRCTAMLITHDFVKHLPNGLQNLLNFQRLIVTGIVKRFVAGRRDNHTIGSPREVKYYATTSGYICHLDLGYRA